MSLSSEITLVEAKKSASGPIVQALP